MYALDTQLVMPGHYRKIMSAQQPIRAHVLLQPYNNQQLCFSAFVGYEEFCKRPGKRVLGYSRKKKRLQRLHKKRLKKSKNWDFSKGVSPLFWSKIGNFSMFLFQAKRAKEIRFMIFQKKKTVFQTKRVMIFQVESGAPAEIVL